MEWRHHRTISEYELDSVFYSDFAYYKNLNVIIETPPAVELELLRKASNELEIASKEFNI